jgi:hypothetical protein
MTDILNALKKGEKIRMKSWWWGRYIVKRGKGYRSNHGEPYPTNQLPSKLDAHKWEIYNEEEHGPHNRDPIDAKYEDAYLRDIGRLK